MDKESKGFEFTYSPQTQRDVQQIYERYAAIKMEKTDTAPGESPESQRIKAIDAKAKRRAMVYAIVIDILAALVFGTGLTMTITYIGLRFALGVAVGVIGLVVLICSKTIYRALLRRQMKRCADEVLQLAEQFFGNNTPE